MQSLQYDSRTKNLTLVTGKIPTLQTSHDVLVKVHYAGICGTDLHIIQGEFPCKQHESFSLGHEFTGHVVQVGKDVKTVNVDDRVVIDPNNGCKVCHFCHIGNPHYCKDGGICNTIGIFRDGGWAEYCLIPDEQIHKLPSNITYEQAALCEPLSCLAHGWDRLKGVTVGKKILIIGAGIIGNLWAVNLHLQGHRQVTISEPNASRLQQVEKLDTGFTLVSPDQLKARHANDKNYLFDLVIDCSGFAPAIEHAFSLLNSGGTLCIFGVAPPTAKISIAPFQIYMNEVTILGVNINPYSFPNALGLLDAMGDRYLSYAKLGIKTFKLTEYKDAIEALRKGKIAKAVFKF